MAFRRKAVAIIVGLVLSGCAGEQGRSNSPSSETPPPQIPSALEEPTYPITDEEYLVYSYLLSAPRPSPADGKTARLLVLGSDTVKPTMDVAQSAAACQQDFPAGEPPIRYDGPYLLSSDLWPILDDLFVKNKRTYTFDQRFSFRRPYALLRNTDFSGFFEDQGILGWDTFYKKFPGAEGFKALSRVGFNPEMTRALVYVESAYTTIDTFSTFVLLKKERRVWVRVEAYTCDSGRAGIKPDVP